FDLSKGTHHELNSINVQSGYPDFLYLKIGIDSSLVNNDQYFLFDDLDPIYGMYWTWHTGYVHCKIEGEKNGKPLEYHLGGYQGPYQCVQELVFPLSREKHEYEVRLHLDALLDLPLEDQRIMSPGADALKLMQLLAQNAELVTK
ncbi:MAG: hypothetical protein LPK45_06665, partial [Bacteroidota bacterium]|nr:hypothetical protein [Bacteroidota bacterium]MDX5430755.1 hypothetical protein [Bacteroidota bacterium]MDX5469500.1 hypothetical protein [Bacteroidota bacterium]